MSRARGSKTRARLGWALFAVTVLLLIGGSAFAFAGWGGCSGGWSISPDCRALIEKQDLGGSGGPLVVAGLLGAGFSLLGAIIAVRTDGNRLAWVFSVTGLLIAGFGFTEPYTVHALVEDPGSLPFAIPIAIVGEVLGGPVIFAPFVFFFLLFPTGTTLSSRWRIVTWLAVLASAGLTTHLVFNPGPFRLAPRVENPAGVTFIGRIADVLDLGSALLLLVCLMSALVSLIVRFRRSRGTERQQMKWFAVAALFAGVSLLFAPLFWSVPELNHLWQFVFVFAIGSIPIASAVAILKYRLYDIDVIINRALVYGALTALLAGFYVAIVFGLQAALSPFTQESDIAVAASTLAVAALFRPLRARIQGFIDRRFYRRKFDATRTLERFGTQVRDQVDLASISTTLVVAVQETMQPAHVSLWLRLGGGTR